jgi:hypothetical protein
MKANFLSFIFIYFSESGLFNELWTIQIRKFFSISTRVQGCALAVSTGSFSPSRFTVRMAEIDCRLSGRIAQDFSFFK